MIATHVALPEWKGILTSFPKLSHVQDGTTYASFGFKHYLGGKLFQTFQVFIPEDLVKEQFERFEGRQDKWITVQGTRAGTAPVIYATDVKWFMAELPF